jgi:class 3 adenylate cyclase
VQGNTKGALASIRRALADDSLGVPARARLLPAAVEIAVASGEANEAARHADELAAAADTYQTSALKATAAYARGQAELALGNAEASYHAFRQARTTWEATGATYEVARAREQLGRALRESGDEDAAIWELQAAAARFERLGAVRDAERVAELLMRDVTKTVMKTFLFTDIVGSTELASAVGTDRHWANLLRRHDATLRAVFDDFQGQVVDHTGDGFFAAFEDAADAVGAAIAIQRAVDQEFEFDIRIGVHTDGALQTKENYHGKGVHAAARIGAAASGREILTSRPTMERLPQFAVADARTITLKGFKEPVDVCSVEWERA